MARHYASKDFFWCMPNALLARYFQGKPMVGELDFAAMSETQHDELFAAWRALPDTQCNAMDAEFRNIFDLSCGKGCRAILDETQSAVVAVADQTHAQHFLYAK